MNEKLDEVLLPSVRWEAEPSDKQDSHLMGISLLELVNHCVKKEQDTHHWSLQTLVQSKSHVDGI